MDSTTSPNEYQKNARIAKLRFMFEEAIARVSNNDTGEIYITWKGNSVQFKFSQWLNTQPNLTTPEIR